MAPVDPTDLLKAFRPLLTVLGGIKSITDVPRLSMLMKKYSKKLVSRCVYCNILLSTTPEVLQCFLEQDGWDLINAWLKDSLGSNNYQLICELMDLLVKCPMNIERLKLNDTPKLVKSLTKNSDKEVSDKAKLVVSKWTELIKPNENINNVNLASRKKRKKEKSADDDDAGGGGDTAKMRKVKGGVLQQQTSINDSNTGDVTTSKTTAASKPTEEEATNEVGGNVNRPRTAKVSYGKSRGLGLLEDTTNASSGKSKGSNKKGDDNSDKSGPGNKSNKLNNKTTDNNPVPVSSSGQSKTNATSKQSSSKPTLKEAVGFIEDIVNLSSFTGQARKRRKSDSKTKSSSSSSATSGSNAAKDFVPDSSGQGDEPGAVQEPMDTNDDTSDEMEEERITSASGEDSNSNTNNVDDSDKSPIDVPELDNLVIPEIEPSKLPGALKSILSFGKKLGRAKKSVRWRSDERLKEIKFFELDETERTNVSKSNFGDFRANDIRNERQMLQQLRNNRGIPGAPPNAAMTPSTEKCITYLPWKLTLIDLPPGLPLIESGAQSEEKRIQAAAANNTLNADFFPVKEGAHEYYPKEPDLMEPAGERNDGPTVIPLEDENFTMTDYSAQPPPQPRTGEPYPANRGIPGPPISGPGPFPARGFGSRTPGPPINRGAFAPPGFVPQAPYPAFGPGGGPGGGPYIPPGAGAGPRMIPPRPMPGGTMPGMPFSSAGGTVGWPPRPRPPPVCRYFLKSGSCRFMARCNYLHQYPNTNAPHGSGSSSSSSQSHME